MILGSYNFLGFISRALSNSSYQHCTNPRLRGYPALIPLTSRLINGLHSLFIQPYTASLNKGALSFFSELVKRVVRVPVYSLHLVVGIVAFPFQFLEGELQKRMDSPIGGDIAMAARIRQGRAEFELLASKSAIGSIEREQAMKGLVSTVCLAWDAWAETAG